MGAKRIHQISSKLVKRYIAIDKQLDKLHPEFAELKETFRELYKRGYESPLLQFIEATTQKIDWQKECKRLMKKYMLPGQRKVFMQSLNKRYPRKPVAATIKIVGKKRKSHAADSSSAKSSQRAA